MKLSENFSLNELTKSQTATRKGIDNKPTGIQIIGNFLDESSILNFAHMFQTSTNWHMHTPEGVKE